MSKQKGEKEAKVNPKKTHSPKKGVQLNLTEQPPQQDETTLQWITVKKLLHRGRYSSTSVVSCISHCQRISAPAKQLHKLTKVVGFFRLAKNHIIIIFSNGLVQHIIDNVVDPPVFEQLTNAFGSAKDVGKQANIETVVFADYAHFTQKSKSFVLVQNKDRITALYSVF